MIFGLFVGILVYSFILTIIIFYKDNSSFFLVDNIDIVVAGPICWLLCLIMFLLRPVLRKILNNKKEKTYQKKSTKSIQKVVKRIITIYKNHYEVDEYFDFNNTYDDDLDIRGWKSITVNKAKYEWINKKFNNLMLFQKDETLSIIKEYFELVPEEDLKKDVCSDYFLHIVKENHIDLYRLKLNH